MTISTIDFFTWIDSPIVDTDKDDNGFGRGRLGTDPKNRTRTETESPTCGNRTWHDPCIRSVMSFFSPMDGLAQNLPGDPEVIVPSEI